ncbi:MAG: hypothetical protein KDG55_22455, partial [Rhodocyclaceae bacterium]|nr:hypothetical protein [Rhodocyclaceae bacterium]
MGLVIAAIYLPLYGLFALLALVIGIKIQINGEYTSLIKRPYLYALTGAATSIALGLVWIWAIYMLAGTRGVGSWDDFFEQLAVTLLAPFAFGLATLGISHVRKRRSKVRLRHAAAGALYSVIFLPWIALHVSSNYRAVVNGPVFERVCQNARIEILEKVAGTKSIALVPAAIPVVSEHRQMQLERPSSFFLNQYLLDYIEKYQAENGGSILVRETISGGRKPKVNHQSAEKIEFIEKPIDTITAEYTVTSRLLELENEEEYGIGGARIEIRRTAGNQLIAFAQYYWDNRTFNACPEKAHSFWFVYEFITG